MKLNADVFFLELAQAREQVSLELAFVHFDPNEHPRDLLGKFKEAINGLTSSKQARLPDGTKVTKIGNTFRVYAPDGSDLHSTKSADVAARKALDASLQAGHANSVGGKHRYGSLHDYEDHAVDIGISAYRDDASKRTNKKKHQTLMDTIEGSGKPFGVEVEPPEEVTGVFTAVEKSVYTRAHDGHQGIRSWAAQLAKDNNQDAVALFWPAATHEQDGSGGNDILHVYAEQLGAKYTLSNVTASDDELKAAIDRHGLIGATRIGSDVIILGDGLDMASQVDKLAAELKTKATAEEGEFVLITKDQYDEEIKAGKAH